MEDVLGIIDLRDINIKDYYLDEINRVESYTTWPKNNPMSPTALAKAGFYYTGVADEVRCFQCDVLIRNWAASDHPLSKHENCSPRCPFISGLNVGNVQLVVHDEVLSPGKVHGREQNLTAATSPLNSVGTEVPDELCDPSKMTWILEHAAHPEYGDIFHRFRSFSRWPSGTTHAATKMCQAGFFYSGQDDRVRCFMCGGGLCNWEADDVPWQEHARWFNRCEYLDACRNIPEVKTAISDAQESQRKGEGREAWAASIEVGSDTQATCTGEDSTHVTEQRDLNELIAETEALRDSIKCKVCWMNDVTILFLPCRHLISCLDCFLQLQKCPLCRGLIKASVKVFCSVFD